MAINPIEKALIADRNSHFRDYFYSTKPFSGIMQLGTCCTIRVIRIDRWRESQLVGPTSVVVFIRWLTT